MKKFILKFLLAFSLMLIIITLLLGFLGSYIDPFYNKFTSGKQNSLIIGDSKSFQGIQPAILNSRLKGNYDLPVYNYSFTVKEIAYGDELLESIKLKLDPETKNGLFILSVSPWVLTEREGDNIAEGKFGEAEFVPHNMEYPSMYPNFEYIFTNYGNFTFKSILRRNTQTHDDGWMEDKNMAGSASTRETWEKKWIKTHNNFIKKWKKSEYRVSKLSETVAYLKNYGTVYLVRMPTGSAIEKIEYDYWQDLDMTINKIAVKNEVPYFNFSKLENRYETYDGVHLNRKEGKKFTEILSDSINKHQIKR